MTVKWIWSKEQLIVSTLQKPWPSPPLNLPVSHHHIPLYHRKQDIKTLPAYVMIYLIPAVYSESLPKAAYQHHSGETGSDMWLELTGMLGEMWLWIATEILVHRIRRSKGNDTGEWYLALMFPGLVILWRMLWWSWLIASVFDLVMGYACSVVLWTR